MKFRVILAIALMTIWVPVYAEEVGQTVSGPVDDAKSVEQGAGEVVPQKDFRFVLGGGYTFGGEKIVTMTYSDGSTKSITAGGSYIVHAGVDYRMNEDFYLQGTVAYHFDVVSARNGDVTFSRIPLEMMAYYHTNGAVRLGGGMRYVTGTKIEGTGIASTLNATLGNTFGIVIEGEYMVSPELGVKLRYVSERYKPDGSSTTFNGSHIGILTNIYL